MSTTTLHGVVRGKMIELASDPGLQEGEEVEVVLRPLNGNKPWGEGLRRCAGALADEWTPEDDEILAELEQDRLRSTSRELPS